MPIHYSSATKTFHLQAANTSYVFDVLPNNQLGHIYYGKRLPHRENFSHLRRFEERSNTTSVFEEAPSFSLESVQQEYPVYGTTDFREPALHIQQEDGSRITNFQYESHVFLKNKPELSGLPATYTEHGDEASTLVVTLKDYHLNAELTLLYTLFEASGVITRSAAVYNGGSEPFRLLGVKSMNVDFPDAEFEMLHLSGAWARERHVKTRKLEEGVQQIASTRGISSAQHNPFLALKRPGTDESRGEVFGFSFVYSGNFEGRIEVDHFGVSRMSMGLPDFDFSWKTEPGETFQAPEVVMVHSMEGLNDMSHKFHDLYRSRLVRGPWRDKARPVLLNNWEGTYFDFNEEKIVSMAETASQCGIELFVLDDGWFGRRNDDTTSLGDWFEDESKLPNGIRGLAEKITGMDMRFGLWFEPEMISKQSELFQKHPDWILETPGRQPSQGRNQFVLDFSRPEVVDELYRQMSRLLKDAAITYVKWDMNRPLTEVYSKVYPPDRQQEIMHRYVLGVYDLYERLTTEFPHVLFESCASGGCRFDPGMLYYAPQTWTSDNTDAVERLRIQYGTSMVYPLKTMGAHVSDVPNHQVHRTTSLQTRADVSYFGNFGYELDITKEPDLSVLQKQVGFYKHYRELLQEGDFYRITSPFEGDGNVTSWSVVSKDKKTAVIGRYQVLEEPNDGFSRVYGVGLAEELLYAVEGTDWQLYGAELMYAGLPVNTEGVKKPVGDYASTVIVLRAV
ncbi:alpha-galactosidase [Marinococcus halophilus]|uniref:alpha-galactosidase n=1 Tax=Marinococcus halophilus TaxID=1371 RepID=UPI0009A678A5|nr:alpha-galactosidase [Marinococcus halophilus]